VAQVLGKLLLNAEFDHHYHIRLLPPIARHFPHGAVGCVWLSFVKAARNCRKRICKYVVGASTHWCSVKAASVRHSPPRVLDATIDILPQL
jgi:hypothetical protein